MFNTGENDNNKIRTYTIGYYNLKELAGIYDVSRYSLRELMKPHKNQIGEPKHGYDYDPEQVELIFGLIKLPYDVRIIRSEN